MCSIAASEETRANIVSDLHGLHLSRFFFLCFGIVAASKCIDQMTYSVSEVYYRKASKTISNLFPSVNAS